VTDTFVHYPRKKPPILIAVHESAGAGAVPDLVRKLQSDRNGVHYIVARDGKLFELADPETETVSHISSYSGKSIGVELPNPVGANREFGKAFASRLEKQGVPGHVIEHTRVSSGLGNVVIFYNPLAQCEAFYRLIRQLLRRFPTIPARIGPLQSDGYFWGPQPSSVWDQGGLFPHGAWGADHHFDGFFPVLYLVARQSGLAPEAAWATSIEICEASQPRRVTNLAKYFKTAPADSLPAARAQELVLADRSDLETRARVTAKPGVTANKAQTSSMPSSRPVQRSPTVAADYNKYSASQVATASITTTGKLYDFETGKWV